MKHPRLSKDNISEVIASMTLQEKATLCVDSGWGSMMAGSLTASDAALVPGVAGTTRAIPRLGVPQTVLADGPAGNYKASFGASSADIRATASFKIDRAQSWPVNPVLLPVESISEITVK